MQAYPAIMSLYVPGELHIEVVPGLDHVDALQWDRLVEPDNPFMEHRFLYALESSGSVGKAAGWAPCHILVTRDGELVGAAPLYLKSHSYGEYIFDWGWANAADRAGLDYYPKLVCAVPFTPASGRRLLLVDGFDNGPILGALIAGMREMATRTQSSSIHILFCTEHERAALEAHEFLPRLTYQFHWTNSGPWGSFDEYLKSFRASARRKVNKERREATASGLDIRLITGSSMSDAEVDAMYSFYVATATRKWGNPYLTHAFFRELNRSLEERALVSMAYENGRPVAGALGFQRGSHVYGRHWGCLDQYDKLHFELCYYQFIQACTERGWTRFEAGAQGEHKVKRGLLPSPTYSSHWISHPGLSRAVAEFLPQEAESNLAEMRYFDERSPFRRD